MKQTSLFLTLVLAGLLASTSALKSIRAYGAIPNDSSDEASWANSRAFTQAIHDANNADDDRVAHVPEGDVYYMFYIEHTNLTNLTVRIDGTLVLNDNRTAWPKDSPHWLSALYFNDSSNLTFEGKGTVEGQGYWWWWHTILTFEDFRPCILTLERATNVIIRGITFKNSPYYHLWLHDVKDFVVRDLLIHVDVTSQKKLLGEAGFLDSLGIPTFPLNTDGIDPAGENILIENVTIQCYDDAVAVKPLNGANKIAQCARNITVRNATVIYGVGMTIGSVPPNKNHACIEDVVFDDIVFKYPIKAIYVKPNPGTVGTGIINNITYKNIVGTYPLWYPIWIGPQQQQQPGQTGQGCSFLYPIIEECPTQPRVPMLNIKLENVTFTGGLTLPGVILCNETAPCTGFNFTNVKNTGIFLVKRSYVTKNVYGVSVGSTPAPGFGTQSEEAFEFQADEPDFEYLPQTVTFTDVDITDYADVIVDSN